MTMTMTKIRRSRLRRLFWTALCCPVLLAGAWAQDSPDSGSQTPLGDVVRRQREQQQHSKTAKRVVADDDIPASHTHWTRDWVAEFKIIPAVAISALVPIDGSGTRTALGQKNDKIYVWFGPHLGEADCSNSLDCAEEEVLRKFQQGIWKGSKARILFDSDETVQDYAARVAHFEVVHDVRGKMQGSVALIATGVATLVASCMYSFQDRPEAERECDAFISSLRIDFPQKYIYVGHP
jgi:hypothetical protein